MPSQNFIKVLELDTPKMNPLIMEGLATKELRKAADYIDSRFRMLENGFPSGFEYRGFQVCDPVEAHAERIRKKDTKSTYDISQTDFYLVKYFFRYKGQDIPAVYMYLPFCNDAGLINISGSMFQISPVIADRVISVGSSDIFIDNGRSKMRFDRVDYHLVEDNKVVAAQIVFGGLYHRNPKKKYPKTTNAKPSNIHYLFAKYGVRETFRRYLNTEVIIGDLSLQYKIDNEYVVVKGRGVRPPKTTNSPDICIAIPRSVYMKDNKARTLANTFIYAADHWPDEITPELFADSSSGDTYIWRALLGHVCQSGVIGNVILADEMKAHLDSLEEYLDPPIKHTLAQVNIEVNSFFDLMFVISEKFTDWLNESPDKMITMYGKEVRLLQTVMYPITSSILTLYYKLKSAQRAEPDRGQMTFENVKNLVKKHLSQGLMYKIRSQNSEVSGVQYSGDNKYFRITSNLVPQSSVVTRKKTKTRQSASDPTKKIHSSVAEIGSHLSFSKTEPSGRSRISPYIKIDLDNQGVVVRDERFRELLDEAQKELKT